MSPESELFKARLQFAALGAGFGTDVVAAALAALDRRTGAAGHDAQLAANWPAEALIACDHSGEIAAIELCGGDGRGLLRLERDGHLLLPGQRARPPALPQWVVEGHLGGDLVDAGAARWRAALETDDVRAAGDLIGALGAPLGAVELPPALATVRGAALVVGAHLRDDDDAPCRIWLEANPISERVAVALALGHGARRGDDGATSADRVDACFAALGAREATRVRSGRDRSGAWLELGRALA